MFLDWVGQSPLTNEGFRFKSIFTARVVDLLGDFVDFAHVDEREFNVGSVDLEMQDSKNVFRIMSHTDKKSLVRHAKMISSGKIEISWNYFMLVR